MMKTFLHRGLGAASRVHDWIVTASYWLGSAALGLIVAIFSYEVVMRYFFAAPTKWGSDAVSFLLLISVFLVIPHVTRIGGNVSVPIFLDMMQTRPADLLRRFGLALGAGVSLWTSYVFWGETRRLFERGTVTLTTVQFPKWILFAFILFGMLNVGLCFLRLAFGKSNRGHEGQGQ